MGDLTNVFSHYAFYLVILALAALVVSVKVNFSGEKLPWKDDETRWSATAKWLFYRIGDVIMVAICFFLLALLIVFPFTLGSLWKRFANTVTRPVYRAFAVAFLFLLAMAVSFLRKLFPRSYAVVEITVGLVLSWVALSSQPAGTSSLLQGIALAASVYALVNGVDDFAKGVEEKKKTIF